MDKVRAAASSAAQASRRSSDWLFTNATNLANHIRRRSGALPPPLSQDDDAASAANAATGGASACTPGGSGIGFGPSAGVGVGGDDVGACAVATPVAGSVEAHEQERIESLQQLNEFLLSFPVVAAPASLFAPYLSPLAVVCAWLLLCASVYVYIFSLASLLKVLGFFGPAYATFVTVETDDEHQHVQWLKYWAVFGLSVVALEPVTDAVYSARRWYPVAKVVFYLFLVSPWTDGAVFLYDLALEPLYLRYGSTVHGWVRSARSGALQATTEIRQVSTMLIKNAAASFAVAALQGVSQSSQSSKSQQSQGQQGQQGQQQPLPSSRHGTQRLAGVTECDEY